MDEEKNINQLPKGWKWVKLEEIVSLLGDGLHGTPEYSENGDYYFINGNNLSDGKILIKENTKRVSIKEYEKYKKQLNDKTILVSINGTIGNVAFYKNEKVILGKSACYFNVIGNVDKHYVRLMLTGQRFLNYAHNTSTGSTIKNVSLKSMREFKIPLPEKTNQQAIVSKIEELFSELDKGIENLRTAQLQLKTYRQSVLKWAFEGKLTNENVKEGELPKGWKWESMENVTNKITDGEHLTPKRIKEGEMLLSAKNVRDGFIDYRNYDCISKVDFDKCLLRCNPEVGDVLIVSVGATIGRASIVKEKRKFALVRSVALLKPKVVLSEYLLYFIQSPQTQKQIQQLSQGSAQSCLYINKIKQIVTPLPKINEQNKIVQEIEGRLSVVDKMEESITQSLQQAEALRQSILKKAFEGKLVDVDA